MYDFDEIVRVLRGRYKSKSKEIVSNENIKIEGLKCTVPKIGVKKELLDLAERNIVGFKHELKIKKTMIVDNDEVLNGLKEKLRLKKIPKHIECFDNSNLQGTNAVSSCVVFINGVPEKKEYRKFNIKTVVGADDFATMEEVIFRRYSKNKLPDLIIVDGGRGQLNAAVKVLKGLKVFGGVDIIGIAKKFEEIYFYKVREPFILEKDSKELHLIQFIRDEAHRFAINFHKKKRMDSFLK